MRTSISCLTLILGATSLTPAAVLYQEDFDGDLSAWTKAGTDNWSVVDSKLRSNNSQNDAIYLDSQGSTWTDYELSCRVSPYDDDGVGFFVRRSSDSQQYLILMDKGQTQLIQYNSTAIAYSWQMGGTVLRTISTGYSPDTSYDITVTVEGQSLTFVIDDVDGVDDAVTIFDAEPLTDGVNTSGTIGLFSRYMKADDDKDGTPGDDPSGVDFDSIVISDLNAGPLPLELNALAVSHQAVQLSWDDVGNTETLYRVYQLDTDGSTWNEIGTVTDDDSPSYTYQVDGLSPSTQYDFKVDAE